MMGLGIQVNSEVLVRRRSSGILAVVPAKRREASREGGPIAKLS
jgi:hypothetical protein